MSPIELLAHAGYTITRDDAAALRDYDHRAIRALLLAWASDQENDMTTTHDTAATAFILSYTNGTPDSVHATQADAIAATGWADPVISDSYCTEDDSTAVSVYETQVDHDEDDDGAFAPRVTEAAYRSDDWATVSPDEAGHRAESDAADVIAQWDGVYGADTLAELRAHWSEYDQTEPYLVLVAEAIDHARRDEVTS